MEPLLRVENLSVKFNEHHVLKDVNFSVNKADVLAIVGPNGAGKSVLFRAILGLVPHYGQVQWAKNIKVNYVPQKLNIDRDIPLSVAEFLKFKTKNYEETAKILRAVGLTDSSHDDFHIKEHVLKQRLGWLSGGQLQRVLIAWAMIDNPDVLLFDEPTSGIDIGGEETIYNLLRKLNKEHSMTIIMISHELNIVYKYANSVLCLNKEMICYGSPNDVLDPQALAKLYGGEAGFYKHDHDH
ncbi:MAG: hypothetical protein A3J46_02165 [Candidatus Yanofskybacteria bacterium RIFCSPHIGHO2_02_FULL_41_11]|uniref:ABC transporter domain-containing protein n=1 Tax=Candidatus Yanofskybacteria bacterium RIFCSPHIGHO2_02_FULL_41_11 TaxID=1802675 RepID=A0A1F8FDP1_9BACT|nr:MAG: hypothetical protein A3J46_02165 [Candidatus Yanofskybacteria bacterium RIFCSPHIGHO2_02_FULL_41_11]